VPKVWFHVSGQRGMGQSDDGWPNDRPGFSGFGHARQMPELREDIPGDSIPIFRIRNAKGYEAQSWRVLPGVHCLRGLLPLY
jgi:hypothetical protein